MKRQRGKCHLGSDCLAADSNPPKMANQPACQHIPAAFHKHQKTQYTTTQQQNITIIYKMLFTCDKENVRIIICITEILVGLKFVCDFDSLSVT